METSEGRGRLRSVFCAGAVYSTGKNTDNQTVCALKMQEIMATFALTKWRKGCLILLLYRSKNANNYMIISAIYFIWFTWAYQYHFNIPGMCFSVQAIKSPDLEGHFSYKTSYTFKIAKNRNRNRPIIQSGILSYSDLFYNVLFWAF